MIRRSVLECIWSIPGQKAPGPSVFCPILILSVTFVSLLKSEFEFSPKTSPAELLWEWMVSCFKEYFFQISFPKFITNTFQFLILHLDTIKWFGNLFLYMTIQFILMFLERERKVNKGKKDSVSLSLSFLFNGPQREIFSHKNFYSKIFKNSF